MGSRRKNSPRTQNSQTAVVNPLSKEIEIFSRSYLRSFGKLEPMRIALLLCATSTVALAQSPIVPVLRQRTVDVTDPVFATERTITIEFGTEEIMDEAVRFSASYSMDDATVTKDFDFLLFKNVATGTTTLLKYVDDDDYLNSFIHRNVRDFVIQGGGFNVVDAGEGVDIDLVPTDAPIVNEFEISNTEGTLSMAKTAQSPDTATSQWFVSTNTNNDNLDLQNGGFTVFGRISKDTYQNALDLNNLTDFFEASFGGALTAVPLVQGTTQATLDSTDFFRFSSVERVPLPAEQAGNDTTLTYRIATANGADSIQASLTGKDLNIIYNDPRPGDTKTFRIEAEDSIGNIVEDEFTVSITAASFDDWRQFFFTEPDASDDNISGPAADPDGDGVTNSMIYMHGLDFENPNRSFATTQPTAGDEILKLYYPIQPGLETDFDVIVDHAHDLEGPWVTLPDTRFITTDEETGRIISVSPADPAIEKEFFRVRTDPALDQ